SLSVVLFLQVVFRYVLQQSLAWSEEAARFGLVWLGMLSATIAARKGFHFLFRWGTLALGATARAWLRQAVHFFVIGFLALILRSSFTYLEIGATETAPATGVDMRIPFAAITVGVGLLIAVYVLEVLDALCSMITGHRFSEREQEELRIYDLLTQKRASHS